jgi:hypothetical protein
MESRRLGWSDRHGFRVNTVGSLQPSRFFPRGQIFSPSLLFTHERKGVPFTAEVNGRVNPTVT